MNGASFGLACGLAVLASTATAPARAAGPYDGTYVGHSSLTKSMGDYCGKDADNVTRTVSDGVLLVRWGAVDMRLSLAPDGTFKDDKSVGNAMINVKGRIAGNMLSYDLTGPRCGFHYELQKR